MPSYPILAANLCAMPSKSGAKELKRRGYAIGHQVTKAANAGFPDIIIRDEPDDLFLPFLRELLPDSRITWIPRTRILVIQWNLAESDIKFEYLQ
jgi:hypothetical protein